MFKSFKQFMRKNNRSAQKHNSRGGFKPYLELLENRLAPSAAPVLVSTDQPDYAPGSTATINASGFQPGATVELQVVRTDGIPDISPSNDPWLVTDNGAGDLDPAPGNIQTTWYVDPYFAGADLQVSATGANQDGVMETATAAFTDGPGTPTGLAANFVSLTKVDLQWTANSPRSENEFLIERSTASDFSSGVVVLNDPAGNISTSSLQTFTDVGPLAANTTYYYRVRGHKTSSDDFSLYSNVVNITTPAADNVAPVTTATPNVAANGAGWNNTNVIVTLSATDTGGSGVQSITYSASGAQTIASTTVPGSSTSFTISGEGTTTITYHAIDVAGNVETTKTLTLKIDKTAPTVVASRDGTAYAAAHSGWNNSNVTVSFIANDGSGSGVVSTPANQVFNSDGTFSSTAVTVTDVAGNTSVLSNVISAIKIDKTAPTVVASRDGTAYAAAHSGWNNSNVTVSFSANDGSGSGVSNPASQVFNSDGTFSSTAVTVTDVAGNTSAPSNVISPIKIDKTAPTVVAARDGTVYAAAHSGWNNSDVTVSFSANDGSGSGVSNPANQVFNTDGTFSSTAVTVTDVAGNTSAPSNVISPIKIDKTAPTVVASRDGTAYATAHSGWNNSNVIVSFSANDGSGSGVSNPVNQVFSTDGTFSSTAVTVTDVAGNTSAPSNVISPIKIDKTAPTVVASRDGTAYAAAHSGWNNSAVTVSFAAADGSGSGVSNPADQVFNSDGTFSSTAVTVTDVAGNTSAPSNVITPIKIDKTAPTVVASRDGTAYAAIHSGWNNSAVTVSFAADDGSGSGVSNPANQVFNSDGTFSSTAVTVTDVAGNTSAPSNVISPIKIDETAPTVVASRDGTVYAAAHSGWNNSAVTVSFSADDGSGSGVTNPADQVFTSDGTFSSTAVTVTDVAGNTSALSNVISPIKIDETAPTVVASRNGTAYAAAHSGWNNSAVTVSFSADDGSGSGVSNPADQVFNSDGTFSSTAVTATDVAGNTSAPSNVISDIKIDETAPTVVATRDGTVYAAAHSGWNNSAVTVSFSADDGSGSGVTNPADQVFNSDGTFSSTAVTVTDVAGNTSAPSNVISPIKIDETAPTVVASRDGTVYAAAHSGWNNSAVTVSFSADDGSGSGVSNPADQVFNSDGTFSSTAVTVTDVAGNTSTPSNVISDIKIDETAPTVVASRDGTAYAAAHSGWNNSAVTVSFSADDGSGSGVSNPADQVFDSDGTFSSTAVTVTDVAGNTSAPSNVISDIKIDETAPTVVASRDGSAYAAAHSGWNNSAVTVSFSADDGSGSGVTNPVDENFTSDGTFTSTAKTVTDVAGNTSAPSNTFAVKIDQTLPNISASAKNADNTPYTAGTWTNQNVTVHFDSSDDLSGIASTTPDQTVTTASVQETPIVNGTATDVAGNTASTNFGPIQIDKVAPVTDDPPAGTLGTNGWYISAVNVTLTAADVGSGVAATYYSVDSNDPDDFVLYTDSFTISTDGIHTLYLYSVDNADNVEETKSEVIKIDTTAPTISAVSSGQTYANAHSGWNNTSVTVSYIVGDTPGSGINTSAPSDYAPDVLSASGTANGIVYDLAGKSATAYYTAKIDTVAPTSTIAFPVNGGGPYTQTTWNAGGADATPDISGTTTDAASGVAKVEVSVFQVSSSKYWDPAANGGAGGFTSSTEVVLLATGTTNWSVPFVFTNFPTDGSYTIKAHGTDVAGNREGSPTSSFTIVVNVVKAFIEPDTSCFVNGAVVNRLRIQGTTDADDIVVSPTGNNGGLAVSVWNGVAYAQIPILVVSTSTFVPVYNPADPTQGVITRILVKAGDGDDNIQIAGSVKQNAWLYGEGGADRLKGGAGANVLFEGGANDDMLIGGGSRNLLIGGLGADRLVGNGGDDILIGGCTNWDANDCALNAIMKEWTSATSYDLRVKHLSGAVAGGLNGSTLLNSSTVHADGSANTLTGSSGQDLYFISLADKATDLDTSVGKKKSDTQSWFVVS